MVIDFDTTAIPLGHAGWQVFLAAVEGADSSDESRGLEFKAHLDPASKAGGAALAKAIAAFANRDPGQAAAWFGGHGVILVGIEPGKVPGIEPIDPAALADNVDRFLAEPRPVWGGTLHSFQGRQVLVVEVAPPRTGDPIALIGKTGPGVEDGRIYVRGHGKSAPATHAEVRRLESRYQGESATGLRISVEVDDGVAPITSIVWAAGWLEDWIAAEEADLLGGLGDKQADGVGELLRGLESARRQQRLLADSMFERREETRSEEEFRAAVDAYLDRARETLPTALDMLRSHFASPMRFLVCNRGTQNFHDLRVQVHVGGDVTGTESNDDLPDLSNLAEDRPRPWGPWHADKFGMLRGLRSQSLLASHLDLPGSAIRGVGPAGPLIENGGSVTITFPEFDLRPDETVVLEEVLLCAAGGLVNTTRAEWRATASNVDAVAEGTVPVPVEATTHDVSHHLR